MKIRVLRFFFVHLANFQCLLLVHKNVVCYVQKCSKIIVRDESCLRIIRYGALMP